MRNPLVNPAKMVTPRLLNQSALVLRLLTSQPTDKSSTARDTRLISGSTSEDMACHLRAFGLLTAQPPPLSPAQVRPPQRGLAKGTGARGSSGLQESGCQGRSPVTAATGVQAAQVSPTSRHASVRSSGSDTDNYMQSSSAKVSFLVCLFCDPSKPKVFYTPQASTFTCCAPINTINNAAVPRVPGSCPPSRARHGVAAGQAFDSPGR